MEDKLFLQVVGFFILLLGAILSYNPELVSNKPIPQDTFQAVERRVRWGFLMGVGMLLIFHHQVTPFLFTLAGLGMTLTLGALIARVIGIVLDGSVPRHWIWVLVEIVMIIGFGVWYVKQRT